MRSVDTADRINDEDQVSGGGIMRRLTHCLVYCLRLTEIDLLIDLFSFLTGLIPRTLGPFSGFILLNGWICLNGVLD